MKLRKICSNDDYMMLYCLMNSICIYYTGLLHIEGKLVDITDNDYYKTPFKFGINWDVKK